MPGTVRQRRSTPRSLAANYPAVVIAIAITAAGAFACAPASREPGVAGAQAAREIPARLTDSAFWHLLTTHSEPDGYFRSDNFVSNELTFQYVIPELVKTTGRGDAYLGVGPDQNFTYVIALQPKIAFIFDIRRQNMVHHLMYKALIEMSADRAEFLSRLFSRERPANLASGASIEEIFRAFMNVRADEKLFDTNLEAIKSHLVSKRGFPVSPEDLATIDYVFSAFYLAGPDINYSSRPSSGTGRGGTRRMPTFAEVMLQGDMDGVQRGYLASEENFRILREMHLNNRIVPVVGDFAGDKAIRSVGNYLRDHKATVTAFYTSNVEQYLFQQGDDWPRFIENVATLPLDDRSMFIRAVFNSMASSRGPALWGSGPRSETLLGSIERQVQAYREGRIRTYFDLIQLSH
jgi:hypothetical protein